MPTKVPTISALFLLRSLSFDLIDSLLVLISHACDKEMAPCTVLPCLCPLASLMYGTCMHSTMQHICAVAPLSHDACTVFQQSNPQLPQGRIQPVLLTSIKPVVTKLGKVSATIQYCNLLMVADNDMTSYGLVPRVDIAASFRDRLCKVRAERISHGSKGWAEK